ncbi:MAG: DeoR/GlpR family DNA-binding transcription regulator [Caldilineaceae bacterium]|nr:DeoR/GlpR family DNA-binding transcription regulator [Caldilineaceae bacterium]
MYSAERRQEILKRIHERARVSVAELADHFGVSRASIRRDLNFLHDSGLLQRTYGGALGANGAADEAPFTERQIANLKEKERIGHAAAQLIAAGETVFIDGGTTTACMAPHLADKVQLTVVTYGLNIVNRLAVFEDLTLIVIGGTLHHPSQTLGGILAINNMQAYSMHFDKAFIAAGGVSAEAGVTNADLEQIPVKRRAVEAAREVILLADSSKLGVVRTALITPAAKVHRLVTDRGASQTDVRALQALGMIVDLV